MCERESEREREEPPIRLFWTSEQIYIYMKVSVGELQMLYCPLSRIYPCLLHPSSYPAPGEKKQQAM